jgi:hypothetical protein
MANRCRCLPWLRTGTYIQLVYHLCLPAFRHGVVWAGGEYWDGYLACVDCRRRVFDSRVEDVTSPATDKAAITPGEHDGREAHPADTDA